MRKGRLIGKIFGIGLVFAVIVAVLVGFQNHLAFITNQFATVDTSPNRFTVGMIGTLVQCSCFLHH
jgi:hypothetical protein